MSNNDADSVVDITCKLNLKTKDVQQTLTDLKKEIDKVFDSRQGDESPKLNNLDLQLKKLVNRAQNANDKLSEIGSKQFMTDAFESASKSLTKLESQYTALMKNSDAMNSKAKKYADLQKLIEDEQTKLVNARSMQAEAYGKYLEDETAYGDTKAEPYLAYQKATREVESLERHIGNLQQRTQNLEFMRASKWEEDVLRVKLAIQSLKDEMASMEESGTAYISGEQTAEYQKLVQQLDELNTALNNKLAVRNAVAQKEADIAKKQIQKEQDANAAEAQLEEEARQRYEELSRLRDEYVRRHEELTAQVQANAQDEANANYASTQEQIKAYEAKIAELEKLMAEEDKAAQHAEAYNDAYNRVRESLMGIQSTTRGLTRLIPGLETSAIQGVVAVTRGVTRLASMGKDAILGALAKIKQAFMKFFAFIAAHPIITAIIAATTALIVAIKIFKNNFEELKKSVTEFLKEIPDVVKKASSTIVSSTKAIVSVLTSLNKILRTIIINIGTTLVNIVKKVISFIAEFKESIKETLEMMASLNDGINEVNTSILNLTSSLSFLERAFGAAFAPILNYIQPTLSQFTDMCAEAMNSIGMLFAKLLGAKYYTKVIKKQKEYNDTIDDMNKKANESLAPFDKLNVIASKNSGKENEKDDLDAGFEAINIELMSIDDIIADLKGKGTEMGQSLKDTLADIDWNSVVIDAGKAGEAIGGFIKEFQGIDGLDIELGEALAGIFNAFVLFFDNLGEEIDAFELGQTLGTIINTFLSNLDAKSAGKLITKVTNGVVRAIKGFISTIDGYQVGKKFADILNEWFDNFDFEAFGEMLSSGLDTLVDALHGWLDNFNVDEMAEKLTTAIEAFIKGINWYKIFQLVDLVAIRFVTFFNTVLTPEKMKRVGEVLSNLIAALLRGIKIIATETKWQEAGEAIAAGIAEVLNKLDFKEMAEVASDLAIGILNMLTSALSSINWNTFGEKLVTFVSSIKWEDLGNSLVNLSQSLMNAFDTVWSNLEKSGELDELFKVVAKLYLEKEKWSEYLEGLGDTVTDAITDEVINQKNELYEAGLKARGYLMEGLGMGPKPSDLRSDGHNIGEVIGTVRGDSKVASVFSDAGKTLGEDIIDGISKGMSEQVNSNTFQTAMNKVTADAEKAMRERTAWNSHSPAQSMIPLGKDIVDGIVKGMNDYDFQTEMTNWYNTKVKPWFDAEYWTTIAKGITDGIKAQMKITKSAMLGNWVTIKEKSGEKIDKLIASVTKKFNTLKLTLDKTNNKIHDGFVDTFTTLANDIKTPLQTIINVFALFSDKIIDCTNSMITNMNKLDIDMPSWLTGTSDKTFNFGLSKISHVTVPKLAQGTVIPPNMSQFLALLGDNNKETEVVSPLSTIEQALRNVLTEQNVNVTFQVEGDPHGMFRVVQKEATSYTKRTGRLAF